ncbi:MAG: type II toxin-antitoxin system CcdA family antitoxin [Thiolinea sp.]
MEALYDISAPKKPTNLSINSDLLRRSRELEINLSATLENALKEVLAKQQEARWKKENRAAIISYNAFVEEHGCFSDEYRNF